MNNGKFWNNQNIPEFDQNEMRNGLISNFYKFGKRLGQKCLRKYILIRQYLLYSNIGNCQHFKGSVRLDGVYASFQISNSECQIYLKKNGLQIVLYTDDVNQFETWAKLLSNCCILSTFHEDITLGNLIGNGSFSTVLLYSYKVYEGRNKEGDVFAIKAIHKKKQKSFAINQQYEEQLLSEISSLREMDHASILKLHRVYETAEKLYLVTEFIQGYELIAKATSKLVFQGNELKCFIRQMLLAIKEIHQHNIMHRDIKPQNILLKNGQLSQPILIDFGLAVSTEKKELPFPSCGSPGYSAPEIIRFDETKKQYSGKCDIFSFGITLFVIIYGYNPFKTQDQKQTLKRNADAYFEFPNSNYPQEQHLILLMTKKYPKDRITVAQALAHPFFQTELYQTIKLPKAILSKQQYEMSKNFNKINVHASLEMDRDLELNYAIHLFSSSPQNLKKLTLVGNSNNLKQIDEFKLDYIVDSVDITHIEKLKMGQSYFSNQKLKISIQF
ncbi:unnamed protein product (macronuclear) [Paramecium tetraurelia]|uniref:Protein kinase domain-containing protein n=1 Tax=Paramecium tetraurelia TaxID=5888 RepID=A0DJV1_PARTE|nr:uncharacterized protein GSPATT00017662001 [Paramecium tetraurelia]CAK83318.1 unnamed protein product [Paramecium tetraurelia]|eukprot:XP_001450715.1 hypothetical protein (macronuclear) [Paramecium tetraurelia strain d4-2]